MCGRLAHAVDLNNVTYALPRILINVCVYCLFVDECVQNVDLVEVSLSMLL